MMGNQNGEVSVIGFYILVCSYLVCWVLINGRNTLGFIFIWWRMPRVLTMNINEMTMELLVKENETLKCQVNLLLIELNGYHTGFKVSGLDAVNTKILSMPEQCLNSIKADTIEEFANEYCGDCKTTSQCELSYYASNYAARLRGDNG